MAVLVVLAKWGRKERLAEDWQLAWRTAHAAPPSAS